MKSMTGYGIEYGFFRGRRVMCWIKSLNHKFLEIYFNLPYELISLEPKMRNEIKRRVKRGKVEVNFRMEKKRGIFSLIYSLIPFWGDSEERVMDIFLSALYKFEEAREREGELIKDDIIHRIDNLKTIISDIQILHEKFPEHVRKVIRERVFQVFEELHMGDRAKEFLRESGGEKSGGSSSGEEGGIFLSGNIIDEAGVIHIVRKSDISEEITRATIHISAFEEELERDGDGKKLMFLAQEILRELNTMGAKTLDAAISEKVIEAKLEIERIREQLYNVE